MSFFTIHNDKAVSDFESYYISTSAITFDLYNQGIMYFYENDIEIPYSYDEERSVVTAQLADVHNYEQHACTLVDKDYRSQVMKRIYECARASFSFNQAYRYKRYDLFESTFRHYVEKIIPLMATANFYPNFVDPDDDRIENVFRQHDPRTSQFLLSQPELCPFLKLLEFGQLKVESGLWTSSELHQRRLFLLDLDVTDYFADANIVKTALPRICTSVDEAKALLKQRIEEESLRKKKVHALRRTYLTGQSSLASVFFSSIDVEESRHYWQAKFTIDASRLCITMGLPLIDTTIEQLTAALREI
ncbi:hypothetical protein RB981_002710 [Vibrio cholerae]|jgi:hypothetical protein|uniref:hypothetical protein n=1 Tax=Vibrio cholerae TaxID=666 RepID=UPI0011D54166|nr:hypothetical protein [Vibrio cholerae]ELE7141942.1 hypothetical protein [Vibrio cholerae]MCR9707117.1 hypothetical protein [Vibrio cholerae]MCR9871748.1 hypothetical protein [Vibrio cholerae]TXZ95512.1 hypothetical protein FXE30_02545 [Vibrio cholerae]